MRFIAFSDAHFHPHNIGATMLEGGMNSRLMDVGNAVRQVYQYARDTGIDTVVFAGDLFHTKKNIDVTAFNLAWRIIKSEAKKIRTLMIPGNHDIASPDGSQTSLEAFDGDNVTVFSQPEIHFSNPEKEATSCLFGFLPFPAKNGKFNRENFFQGIETLKDKFEDYERTTLSGKCFRILVSHAYTNELMKKHHGLEGDFSVDELSDYFDLILLGHHHVFDAVTYKGKTRAFSLGSVLPLTFADAGHSRGFSVIDTESSCLHTFIPTVAPAFLSIETADKLLTLDPRRVKDAIIRVKTKSRAEAKSIEEKLVKSEARDWSIEIEDGPAHGSVRLEVGDTLKTNEILDAYMKSEWGKTELAKEKLLKRGLALIEGR